MFFTCRARGMWSTDRPVVDGHVVCGCGDRRAIELRPVYVLTGASGAGNSTMLVGSGVPEQFESRPESRYVDGLRWLALVCDDELARRRYARPAWRGVTTDWVATMQEFTRHPRGRHDMTVLDTTPRSIADTHDEVVAWVRSRHTRRQTGDAG